MCSINEFNEGSNICVQFDSDTNEESGSDMEDGEEDEVESETNETGEFMRLDENILDQNAQELCDSDIQDVRNGC